MTRWTCIIASLAITSLASFAQEGLGPLRKGLPRLDTRWATEVEHLDIDGDGDQDLFLGAFGEQNRLWRNEGSGAFEDITATHLPSDVDQVYAILPGDFDGDGDQDVITLGTLGVRVYTSSYYLNDGSGHFSYAPPSWLPLAANGGAAFDCDGDGDLDLCARTYDSSPQRPMLFLNDGTGRFTDVTATHLPTDSVQGELVVTADFDGDADLDLFLPNAAYGGVPRVYVNDGAGHFTVHPTPLPPVARSQGAALAEDFDGDGILDLFLANSETNDQDQLLLGTGTGAFVPSPNAIPTRPAGTACAVSVDVNGDGSLDLVLGNEFHNVLINDGLGHFTDETGTRLHALGGSETALDVADLDGNGTKDIVALRSDPDVWFGTGTGFVNDVRFKEDQYAPKDIAAADIDGDSDLDLVTASYYPNHVVYRNDGHGTFRRPISARSTVIAGSPTILTGDFDGDGDIDLVGREYAENDGTGDFTIRTGRFHSVFVSTAVHAGAVVDADLDGDLDIVTARDTYQAGGFRWANEVRVNDGLGSFRAWPFPYVARNSWCVAVGDVDGDSDPDFFFGTENGVDQLVLSDAPLFFRDVSATHLPLSLQDTTTAAVFVDVDGDGDLDLALGTSEGTPNRLLRNDGTGRFTDTSQNLPQNLDYAAGIAAADMDLDGAQDLLVAYRQATTLPTRGAEFLRNDGTGRFTYVSLPEFERDATTALRLADLDGDGDLDTLRVGARQLIGWNLTRQLDTPRYPRQGSRHALTIYARPGYATQLQGALVFVSDRLATPLPLPDLGTWWLDPNLSLALPPVFVPFPDGKATVNVTIPPLPAGTPFTFAAQALIAGDLQPIGHLRFTGSLAYPILP